MSSGSIQLGGATYDPETGSVAAPDGTEIALRWQSSQVLALLARSNGRLVPKDDIIAHVWGEVSVTDDSLTQCIADIRRALGDADRTLLRTFPKRGYQLNGTCAASRPAAPAAPEPPIAASLDPRDVLPTLAVLPLTASGPGADDALGQFVADEIGFALGRSGDVNVISRLSTVGLGDADPAALRRDLGADYAVSGAARAQGGTAVLTVEFSETESRLALWSDRIAMPLEGLTRDTDWVEHVASNVRGAIMVREVARLRSAPLETLRLYSVLHGAVGLMHRLSPGAFNEARTCLTYLAEKAPDNPAPLAWMARWHVLRALQGWAPDLRREARSATDCAERALDIDPSNTLALASLGFVMTNLVHRLDEARAHYDAALAVNPNDASARGLRGMLQAFVDRPEEGRRDTERALHLTPRDPHRFLYLVLAAGANLSAGDYERAAELAAASRRLNRGHVSTLRTLAAAHAGAGNDAAAREAVRDLMRLQPGLRVSTWSSQSPSRDFENGRRFAELLTSAGVPR